MLVHATGIGVTQAQNECVIRVYGARSMAGLMDDLGRSFEDRHPEACITVGGGTIGKGFEALSGGISEIVMATREARTPEIRSLQRHGMSLGEQQIGLDGVSVIASPDVTVTTLSLRQLRSIYTSGIRTWSEIGGRDSVIRVNSLPLRESGTADWMAQNIFKTNSFDGRVVQFRSARLLARHVSRGSGEIGYLGHGLLERILERDESLRLKILRIKRQDGPVPGRTACVEHLTDGTYPLARKLFLYWDRRTAEKSVYDFVSFCAQNAGPKLREGRHPVPFPTDSHHRFRLAGLPGVFDLLLPQTEQHR